MATLYLVSTPIGNMEDISIRAFKTLNSVDLLACEDTRETQKLLIKHPLVNIPAAMPKLISYNDHNRDRQIPVILNELKNGRNVALVTDRGTPLISDPGYKLVRAVYDLNSHIEKLEDKIIVDAIPGANAVLPALQLSGLPPDRFLFAGFLAKKAGKLTKQLQELPNTTIIIYESPHRIHKTLSVILETLGDLDCAVCNELTKMYQKVLRGKVSEVLAVLSAIKIRGEITLVFHKTPQP